MSMLPLLQRIENEVASPTKKKSRYDLLSLICGCGQKSLVM